MKKTVGILIRLILALGILFYFFRTNPIHFSDLKALFHPLILSGLLILKFIIYALAGLRWRRILKEMSLSISIPEALGFGFLNVFFTYFLPGNMSSDIAKGTLATKKFGSPARIISSILIDRLMGLFSLLTMLLFGLIWFSYADQVRLQRILAVFEKVSWFTIFLAILCLAVLLIALMVFVQKSHRFQKLKKVFVQFLSFRFWIDIFVLSIFSHLLFAIFLSMTAKYLQLDGIDLLSCVIIFPLATLAMIIPLTPGSTGVGQVLYNYLFDIYAGHPTKAALLFTALQLIDLVFVILGAYFFARLLKSRRPS